MRLPYNGNYRITQLFGNKLYLKNSQGLSYDVYAQWGYLGHNGIDFGLPALTPIVAPHDGRVIEASFDANGYGNYVKLENDDEGSILAHLDNIRVKIGYFIKAGDILGLSGNSGFSTAPHLHWGYYKIPRDRNNGYGGCIDQLMYLLGVDTESIDTIAKLEVEITGLRDSRNKWRKAEEDLRKKYDEHLKTCKKGELSWVEPTPVVSPPLDTTEILTVPLTVNTETKTVTYGFDWLLKILGLNSKGGDPNAK